MGLALFEESGKGKWLAAVLMIQNYLIVATNLLFHSIWKCKHKAKVEKVIFAAKWKLLCVKHKRELAPDLPIDSLIFCLSDKGKKIIADKRTLTAKEKAERAKGG